MKLLLVAATEGEIKPLTAYLQATRNNPPGHPGTPPETLITGVGMTATAYALTKKLQEEKYDLVLQVGVCGSFDRNLAPGTVVLATSDCFADLGAEDHDNYIDIFEMGLLSADTHPFGAGRLIMPPLPVHEKIDLLQVSALTVNTVSGNERTIGMRAVKYGCQVESMEGAAFHYVCLQEHVPFAQVRAVSNYVTPRDKSQWKMGMAIANLNSWLIGFMETL